MYDVAYQQIAGGAMWEGSLPMAPSRTRRERFRASLVVLVAALLALSVSGFFTVGALTQFVDVSEMAGQASGKVSHQDDWRLVLVNDTHPMEPYEPELIELRDNQAVDVRCYEDLQRMFDDARAQGLCPKVNSSYRSRQEQQQLFDNTVASYVARGLPRFWAKIKTARTVAEPGTSEHETGLAIDVTSETYTCSDDLSVYEWMAEHSWEYGWILRYPAGKEALTGIDDEPWHFRYVGLEAAQDMHESGQCLEEYLG